MTRSIFKFTQLFRKQACTLGVLLVCVSHSQAKDITMEFPASQESPEGMQVIKSEAELNPIGLLTNIPYATIDGHELVLHLATPGLEIGLTNAAPSGDARPLIVYVPGSAWLPQNLDRSIPHMAAFAKSSGYAIAIVAYRPSTVAKSPAQLVDVKTAIRFLKAKADTYNLDTRQVFIWGTSSGGHLASLVGLTQDLPEFDSKLYPEQTSKVDGVINFFGPTNFLAMGDYPSVMAHNDPDSPESLVIGGPIQDPKFRDAVAQYNPISYISADKSTPPFLIMHGDRDPLVPFNQSVILYEALRDAGKDVQFFKIKDAGHGTRFFTEKPLIEVTKFLTTLKTKNL
jgi:acetyl esterase/lipase